MGLFDRFSLPVSFLKKKNLYISAPETSPVLGTITPYKTLATFELKVDKPKYSGDIPEASIKFYPLD